MRNFLVNMNHSGKTDLLHFSVSPSLNLLMSHAQ